MLDFSSDVFTIDLADGVATLWLDRPEARNACGPAFWDDLPRAMEVLSDADAVRAVVLAARGEAFTVGLDLKAMAPLLMNGADAPSPVVARRRLYREVHRLQGAINAVADCPKPVLAAVHGYCIGAGVDLVTACDVRLASDDAVFSVRETRMAIVADLGTLQRLPRIVNPGHVAELVYTGKDVDAARAEAIGLVSHRYPSREALHAAAHEMARAMAANSPLVVQGAKAVLRRGADAPLETSLDYVALWNAAFLQSDDLGEAVTAFFERREPRFEGR